MPADIRVHLLPDHFQPEDLRGSIAVMVDVLRASTTILTALKNGATQIIPCFSVDDALQRKQESSGILLGGERQGVKIEGFDFGNSPGDYSPAAVQGRTLAFTTTNGTRALLRSGHAGHVLIGAFANVSALATHLSMCTQPIHIVCAGTDGEITGEDVLFAGCFIEQLLKQTNTSANTLTDTAAMSYGWWQSVKASGNLTNTLKQTRGGQNLVALAYESDIELAAAIDSCPVIAEFDTKSASIRML